MPFPSASAPRTAATHLRRISIDQHAGLPAAGIIAVRIIFIAAGIIAAGMPAPAATLDEPVHALWSGLPLAAWAERASQLAGCPVILDRRVDPDAPVSRACHGEPLRDTLAAVAASVGSTVAVLEGTIRIAPARQAAAAARGESLRRQDTARLSPARRRALTERREWSWPAGATPRDLVAATAADAGLVIDGLATIPHDHRPAASLPPLSLGERLDLVLADYDLRVEWRARGAAGRIVPLPPDAEPPPAPNRSAGPPAAVRPLPARPDAPGPRTWGEPLFTLRLEAPLDEAVAALAARFGLAATIDRAALAARGVAPGEIVRVEVRDASRDALLDAVVKPLGLRWRIDGTRLTIDAAGVAPADAGKSAAP